VFVLVRAIVYASLFIGALLIYLPGRLVSWSGMVPPAAIGIWEVAGIAIGTAGVIIAIWSVLAFALIGRGTPAPFDPPRRLVIRGPYRFVRNPMYIGAGLALTGAGIYYASWPVLLYAAAFLFVLHLFVLLYEEPTLTKTFGDEYKDYCRDVLRWWPTLKT
jgi:protein-S-isoprenylcysteine O-methyltransferase Ste14